MSILSRKKTVEPVRLEPTHRKPELEKAEEFWNKHQITIGLIIILILVLILLVMIGYAFATGHMHGLSSEANQYEHLNQIVLYVGGRSLC